MSWSRHLVSRLRLCFLRLLQSIETSDNIHHPAPTRAPCNQSHAMPFMVPSIRRVCDARSTLANERVLGITTWRHYPVYCRPGALLSLALHLRDWVIHCLFAAGIADQARQETARHGELSETREDRRRYVTWCCFSTNYVVERLSLTYVVQEHMVSYTRPETWPMIIALSP